MEVLFELKGSRTELKLNRENVCHQVEQQIAIMFKKKARVVISGERVPGENVYILQVWNQKWDRFLNVISPGDLSSGDILTVCEQPVVDSPKKVSEETLSLVPS